MVIKPIAKAAPSPNLDAAAPAPEEPAVATIAGGE